MNTPRIPADEQLSLAYDPDSWALYGPDEKPVFEARPTAIFYHRLFGRWRDLPPGDRMSVAGVLSVEVRWDGGWAVGVSLAPDGLWRRLVRWEDSRDLPKADAAARALSILIGRPLRAEALGQEPALTRVRFDEPPQAADPAPEAPPPPDVPPVLPDDPLPVMPAPRPVTPPPEPAIYNVADASDVRLPLRLGGGASLAQDDEGRLVLKLGGAAPTQGRGMLPLGAGVLALLVVVFLLLRGGLLGANPLLAVLIFGALLIGAGVGGLVLLLRWQGEAQPGVAIFDREARAITLPPALRSRAASHPVPVQDVHGVRIQGRAEPQPAKLAYARRVSLMLDSGDLPLITEIRVTDLPADPAVMPALADLRQRADDLAGPSLARAGARVIAWYLGIPLADE